MGDFDDWYAQLDRGANTGRPLGWYTYTDLLAAFNAGRAAAENVRARLAPNPPLPGLDPSPQDTP